MLYHTLPELSIIPFPWSLSNDIDTRISSKNLRNDYAAVRIYYGKHHRTDFLFCVSDARFKNPQSIYLPFSKSNALTVQKQRSGLAAALKIRPKSHHYAQAPLCSRHFVIADGSPFLQTAAAFNFYCCNFLFDEQCFFLPAGRSLLLQATAAFGFYFRNSLFRKQCFSLSVIRCLDLIRNH